MATVAFVINPSRVRDVDAVRDRCQQAAIAHGWRPELLQTTDQDRGSAVTSQALAAGAELVFAAGGDGTVRACAQALAGGDVPLAIVPLGTANLAARALGLPARPGDALTAGFTGRDRRIDVGVVEDLRRPGAERVRGARPAAGMVFLAMAGMGLDAAVVGSAPGLLKERLGWLGYAAAGLARMPGRRTGFTIRADGTAPREVRARSVVIGNAGLLPGGFTLLPAARMDDGELDVGVLAPADPLAWVSVAQRVLTNGEADDRSLTRFRARRAEVVAADELPRQVDGEVIEPGRSLTVTVMPAALTVRVAGSAGL